MDQSSFERFTNSRLYALGDKLGDVFLLSFFWLIFSIPVVTMGASTSALYYAINKRHANQSETPLADFWRSFKQNFFQGIALTVILLLYLAVTVFNIYFSLNGWNGVTLPSWYWLVAILLVLPFFFTAMYVFPYLARFKNSVRNILFHSFTFSTMYLGHTILMWLLVIASIALMIFFFPSLLFAPYLCCYLCWRLVERDFGYALHLKKKREEAAANGEAEGEGEESQGEDSEEESEEESEESDDEEAEVDDEESSDEDDGEGDDEDSEEDDSDADDSSEAEDDYEAGDIRHIEASRDHPTH